MNDKEMNDKEVVGHKTNSGVKIELFFEHASQDEITSRLKDEFFITNMHIAVG